MKVQCINISLDGTHSRYIYTFREVDTNSVFSFPHEKAGMYSCGEWYTLDLPK